MKKLVLICDMCTDEEHAAKETIKLKLNGYSSTLDVCPDRAKELRETVLAYMKYGRESGTPAGISAKNLPNKAKASIDPEQYKVMREWAEKNGIPYNKRGALKKDVIDAYQTAHSA